MGIISSIFRRNDEDPPVLVAVADEAGPDQACRALSGNAIEPEDILEIPDLAHDSHSDDIYDHDYSDDDDDSSDEKKQLDEAFVLVPGVDQSGKEIWMQHYSNRQRILLVGDGDFSFSVSLASAFGLAPLLVATSLDSREFLSSNYRQAIFNLEELRGRGCEVFHHVDATKMACHPSLRGRKFDRILFNFPYAVSSKDESRARLFRRHEALVEGFLRNGKEMLRDGGEIHITHKSKFFHGKWKIKDLANRQGLEVLEAVHFNYADYPGYHTKHGFGGNSDFHSKPSKTFKFGLKTY